MTKPMNCVDCKALITFTFKSLDGKPRCGRCHVFAAEKAKRK